MAQHFLLKSPDGTPKVITGEVIAGRNPDCGLRLPEGGPDGGPSRRHARLWIEEGALWAQDLGSKNGTFVNDERFTAKVQLQPGDRLRFDRVEFVVHFANVDTTEIRRVSGAPARAPMPIRPPTGPRSVDATVVRRLPKTAKISTANSTAAVRQLPGLTPRARPATGPQAALPRAAHPVNLTQPPAFAEGAGGRTGPPATVSDRPERPVREATVPPLTPMASTGSGAALARSLEIPSAAEPAEVPESLEQSLPPVAAPSGLRPVPRIKRPVREITAPPAAAVPPAVETAEPPPESFLSSGPRTVPIAKTTKPVLGTARVAPAPLNLPLDELDDAPAELVEPPGPGSAPMAHAPLSAPLNSGPAAPAPSGPVTGPRPESDRERPVDERPAPPGVPVNDPDVDFGVPFGAPGAESGEGAAAPIPPAPPRPLTTTSVPTEEEVLPKSALRESQMPGAWADPGPRNDAKTELFGPEKNKALNSQSAQTAQLTKGLTTGKVEEPTLVCISGPEEGKRFKLAKLARRGEKLEWSLGSDPGQDVVLSGEGVSAQHACLVNEGERWKIFDRLSSNGTFVNNHRTTSSFLSSGDVFRLGTVECMLELPAGLGYTAILRRPLEATGGHPRRTRRRQLQRVDARTMIISFAVTAVILVVVWRFLS